MRWVTQRLGNATASGMNKRNTADWTAPVSAFLDSAKSPTSFDQRLVMLLEHYRVEEDAAWV